MDDKDKARYKAILVACSSAGAVIKKKNWTKAMSSTKILSRKHASIQEDAYTK